jgi:hypothetical protein
MEQDLCSRRRVQQVRTCCFSTKDDATSRKSAIFMHWVAGVCPLSSASQVLKITRNRCLAVSGISKTASGFWIGGILDSVM